MKLVKNRETIALNPVEDRAWRLVAGMLEFLDKTATDPTIDKWANIASNALAELAPYIGEEEEEY